MDSFLSMSSATKNVTVYKEMDSISLQLRNVKWYFNQRNFSHKICYNLCFYILYDKKIMM